MLRNAVIGTIGCFGGFVGICISVIIASSVDPNAKHLNVWRVLLPASVLIGAVSFGVVGGLLP